MSRPSRDRIEVVLPAELVRRLDEISAAEDRPVPELVQAAIEEFLRPF